MPPRRLAECSTHSLGLCGSTTPSGNTSYEGIVADLRLAAGRYPRDETIRAIVEALTLRSDDFTRLWNSEAVAPHEHASEIVQHPDLGRLEIDCDVLNRERGDLRVVVYTAQAGSDAAQALRDLAQTLRPRA